MNPFIQEANQQFVSVYNRYTDFLSYIRFIVLKIGI